LSLRILESVGADDLLGRMRQVSGPVSASRASPAS
jgi:hypothetical protein